MEKLTAEEVKKKIDEWNDGGERARIALYSKYYQAENPGIEQQTKDRQARGKTPNHRIPTAYYTTVVDSMAGYLFNNVEYQTADTYQERLNEINETNKAAVKDMKAGIQALAYNRAVELVYADEEANPRFSNLNPISVVPLYTEEIEPTLFGAIWVRSRDGHKLVDVIYADEWQYYTVKDGEISMREDPKPLYFDECPVVIYGTQVIGKRPPFHQITPYIDALDILISGNSNEVDRLVDALLVIGRTVSKEDLDHMPEWKALQDMKKDDRAEYLTKDLSPVFREYVSKLLIQEIHKHSHVVDWYNPDTGITGATSGKALLTRMFDMGMYANRIEKVYRDGTEKRLNLIGQIERAMGRPVEPVNVIYNRTVMTDVEEKIIALNQATFLSMKTKIEEAGFDVDRELERLNEETANRIDLYGETE